MPDDFTPPAADPAATSDGSGLQIPDDARAQWPDLIDLIVKSESMNDEERQYWINILPIMTPEQLQNLRDILVNERDQLAAIDAKYAKDIQAVGEEQFLRQVGDERRKKADERAQAEKHATTQDASAEDLLKQIDQL